MTSGSAERAAPAFLAPALLVVSVMLVFGRSLGFAFTNWDDPEQVLNNPLVRHPLAGGLIGLVWSPPVQMGYAQPLTVLTHHLDLVVGGGRAWAFHLTNVLLHACNALLVHSLLRTLLGERPGVRLGTFAGAALFAVHPLSAEPVCWVTGRKDLLAVMFVLLGYRAYLELRRGRMVWLAALFGALLGAIGSKPWGVILPFVVAGDLFMRRERPSRPAFAFVAVGSLVAVGWMLHAMATQELNVAVAGVPWERRPPFVLQHAALQVRNLLFPVWLSPHYMFEGLPHDLGTTWGVAGLGLGALLLGAVVLAWRRRAVEVLLGLSWCALAFAPASGVVPLQRGPADTYAYGVLPGVALLVGLGVAALRPLFANVITGGGVLVFGLLGLDQGGIWRSSTPLWERATELYPSEPTAWMLYGESLVTDGQPKLAVRVLDGALKRFPYPPKDPTLLYSLGYACFRAQDWACSLRGYGEMVRHYGIQPQAAFRFLSAWEHLPTPAWELERRKARGIAADVLERIGNAPPAARDEVARRTFGALFGHDEVPVLGLRALGEDPKLAEPANRLLSMYGVSSAR